MEYLQFAIDLGRDVISEPWVARVIAMVAMGIAVYRKSASWYKAHQGYVFTGLEQEQLYTFLRKLVSSSNGWTKQQASTIKYVWPASMSTVAVNGQTQSRPVVTIGYYKDNYNNTEPHILMGNEDVTSALSSTQVARLTSHARSIGSAIDKDVKAGRISALLAAVK